MENLLKQRDNLEVTGKERMDLKQRGYEGVDWTYLAQDMKEWRALVNMGMYLQVP
jgi:hypothetical protein